jgi:hypothetical protein
MISPKTTALIATMSLLGAVTPAAFAQDFEIGDISSSLGVDISKEVNQNIDQDASSSATTGEDSSGDASSEVNQDASQGFCEQISISQATAGRDATTSTTQVDSGTVIFDDSNVDNSGEITGKDCS